VKFDNNITYKQKDIDERKKLNTAEIIFNGDIIKVTYHAGDSDEIILSNPVIQFVYEGDISQDKIISE
jgi:hypothetical protein